MDDKQRALACIRVDQAGLAAFYGLFSPERWGYEKNAPCCEFPYPVKEHRVELSFRINEAGLSKMGTDWLRQLKERLEEAFPLADRVLVLDGGRLTAWGTPREVACILQSWPGGPHPMYRGMSGEGGPAAAGNGVLTPCTGACRL